MKKMVYLVYDCSNAEELIGVCANRERAQFLVYDHLTNGGCYDYEEWCELAYDYGYDTVERFQEALKSFEDYNEDLEMEIVAEELLD